MFKKPFSFEGRIRRAEYCISLLIYLLLAIVLTWWQNSLSNKVLAGVRDNSDLVTGGFYVAWITIIWFMLAQGAKRCHDIGYNGFWQLVPLFAIFMALNDGLPGYNVYGRNAKGVEGEDVMFSFEQDPPQDV